MWCGCRSVPKCNGRQFRVWRKTMRLWTFRTGSLLRKFLFGCVVVTLASCWILLYHVTKQQTLAKRVAVFPVEKCQHPRFQNSAHLGHRENLLGFNVSLEKRVLIISRQTSITFRAEISPVLEANHISYQHVYMQLGEKVALPELTASDAGRYSIVVFESIKLYISQEKVQRELLDRYCRQFGVGLVLFSGHENYGPMPYSIGDLQLSFQSGVTGLRNIELNSKSCLLRLTRAGGIAETFLSVEWSVFFPNHSTYEAVEFAVKEIQFTKTSASEHSQNDLDIPETRAVNRYTTVLADLGHLDGIRRVYFGSGITFWLHRLLFIDALAFLSRGQFSYPLERRFVVDVDDIFVGRTGTRVTREDVKAMISIQNQIQERVPGFRLNLGFSGSYFLNGNDKENEGDWALVKNAHEFWWFSHMWRHSKPHEFNSLETMKEDLVKNLQFAEEYGIPLNTSYAVAPHHSGVYPPHDILYEGWKKVYNLKATSTEEYPHLHPSRFRRGFIYKNIKVLPRQTCGLYTHTYLLKDYPKGQRRLEDSIYGGELFQVFVDNPISIFMTHLSNYGNDRLALLTFDSVIKYLQCWTNLKLSSEHPTDLAERYFKMRPHEAEPIWQNPCSDPRHKAIWSETKSCHRLPNFLVVGPQKTGTTALYTFLNMHPDIVCSEQSVKTYEEVQFFNGHNYFRGLDWYMDFFKDVRNNSDILLFEKSANYFDNKKTPLRVHALLRHAKIIVILLDPVKRAYSWYQHMKSHGVASARNSFYKVLLSSNSTKDRDIQALGQRCLTPGLYAQHLQRWLTFFPSSQILVLDGVKLRTDPVGVMLVVQAFLNVKIYDYSKRLRFDKHKGFYCQVTSGGGTKCLGKGKGRNYPPMDAKSQKFLEDYYRQPNKELADLLRRIDVSLPEWLR